MIQYYNRKTGGYETEQVAGDKYLNWTYSSPIGMRLLELVIKKKVFSKIYGAFCDSSKSLRKVRPFVTDFHIDMAHSRKGMDEFTSFNDFFSRQLDASARPIDKDQDVFVAPGDGRLLAFENIDPDELVQIKGFTYCMKELLGSTETTERFSGGVCLVLRLCPTDYHRFHFVDNGICEDSIRIPGKYYSVNPIALSKIPSLFCRNKREWSIFHSANFGDMVHVEVGATCVGTIIQTYKPLQAVKKGDEKGYFKFGGSTTIMFIERNRVVIDNDILEQTKLGYETKVLMGETIGKAAG